MSVDTTFKPLGPTVLVVAAAIRVVQPSGDSAGIASFRVRNLDSTNAQYFTWGQKSTITSLGAPTAGVPKPNTIGMLANSVETFEIPATSYFIASSGTGFEFTPGQGS